MVAVESLARTRLAHAPSPLALFNGWQRGLPLLPRPFDVLGAGCRLSGSQVRELLRDGLARGQISRVGALFGVGSGGAATLCAMRVPTAQLEQVAACVNSEPGVNHNYEREHALNLWFVVTNTDTARLHASVERIEQRCRLQALRLPMRRAYRIDLGFDLFDGSAVRAPASAPARAVPVPAALRPLAARLERGLALVERPWAALGEPLGLAEDEVIATLRGWLEQGTLRRLGVVLRHHELGIAANAMAVFSLPEVEPGNGNGNEPEVDAAGMRLAAQPGVTLCYRRESAPGWPYTLYCMVHGRERGAVQRLIDQATRAAGLAGCPREVLFSTRRFKQTGSRYFALEPA